MPAKQSSSRRRPRAATASRRLAERKRRDLAAAAFHRALDFEDRLDPKIAAVAIARAGFAGIAPAMRAGHGALEDILDALPAQDQRRRGMALGRLRGIAHVLAASRGIGSSISAKRPVANGSAGASSTLTMRSRMPRSASCSTPRSPYGL